MQARERGAHALVGRGIRRVQVEPLELDPGFVVRYALTENLRNPDRACPRKAREAVDLGVEPPALGEGEALDEAFQCCARRSAWRRNAGPKRWRS
jgi:hypothetical protein